MLISESAFVLGKLFLRNNKKSKILYNPSPMYGPKYKLQIVKPKRKIPLVWFENDKAI